MGFYEKVIYSRLNLIGRLLVAIIVIAIVFSIIVFGAELLKEIMPEKYQALISEEGKTTADIIYYAMAPLILVVFPVSVFFLTAVIISGFLSLVSWIITGEGFINVLDTMDLLEEITGKALNILFVFPFKYFFGDWRDYEF